MDRWLAKRLACLLVLAAALVCIGWWICRPPADNPSLTTLSGAAAARTPERYTPLRIDVAGIADPQLEYADEVELEDEEIVIGVVVNGEPRAYVREAFAMSPRLHVVTDEIQATPLAITHCDRVGCTRVLTGAELADARSLRVGGWRADQTLALIFQEQEYSQTSPDIPLQDVPFLELPWGMWRELFPDTLVYIGEQGAG